MRRLLLFALLAFALSAVPAMALPEGPVSGGMKLVPGQTAQIPCYVGRDRIGIWTTSWTEIPETSFTIASDTWTAVHALDPSWDSVVIRGNVSPTSSHVAVTNESPTTVFIGWWC